jgi:hypothetical protein
MVDFFEISPIEASLQQKELLAKEEPDRLNSKASV